jgi:hypothetical protein
MCNFSKHQERTEGETYSAKYHAPMTLEAVILKIPRATPHVQSHTTTVPAIAQFAQPCTCPSHAWLPLDGSTTYPMSSKRKMRVRKGIEVRSVTRSMAGESARRKGLAINSSVVSVRVAEVVWTCRGRSTSRRAVSKDRTSGIIENRRSLL